MDRSLTDFVGRLRKAGIPVSPAETLDALSAVDQIELQERSVFKDALRTALVKRGRDIPLYDALFDLYFSRGATSGSHDGPDVDGVDGDDRQINMENLLEAFQPDLSLTAELVMTGQFGPLTKLMLSRSRNMEMDRLQSPLQANFYRRRLARELDLERVARDIEQALAEMGRRGLDPETIRALREAVRRNLSRVEEEVRRLVDKELAQNRFVYLQGLIQEDLAGRNLANLNEDEILAMRSQLERMARRIKDRLSLRLKHGDAGRFDLKRTLRDNLAWGGPLPELVFRHKRPDRPQVVALCDVSRSVRNFSRFMLLFLYTLKEVMARVRSFIFVGDLTEVTGLFQRLELNEAVSRAAAGQGLHYLFRTDYGSVFMQFVQESLSAVTSKTTVIILGDARNNYFDPHPEALAEMADRAKKVLWLNPEPRPNWRIGDSVMELYRPYCTIVAECGNLIQLSTVVEENIIP